MSVERAKHWIRDAHDYAGGASSIGQHAERELVSGNYPLALELMKQAKDGVETSLFRFKMAIENLEQASPNIIGE